MRYLLLLLSLGFYVMGLATVLVAMTPPRGSDIQLILAGVLFTSATVALVGFAVAPKGKK